jgi:hypothetical protein
MHAFGTKAVLPRSFALHCGSKLPCILYLCQQHPLLLSHPTSCFPAGAPHALGCSSENLAIISISSSGGTVENWQLLNASYGVLEFLAHDPAAAGKQLEQAAGGESRQDSRKLDPSQASYLMCVQLQWQKTSSNPGTLKTALILPSAAVVSCRRPHPRARSSSQGAATEDSRAHGQGVCSRLPL